jgi:DNA polymerase-2
VAVANRYFGAFEDGSLKIRGIEARRRDTPPFIKETQLEMLRILAHGHDAAGFRAVVPQAVAYAGERLQLLRAGQVPPRELVVTHRLSRQPEEYTVRTAAARVAQQLSQTGVSLSPGEKLPFLYVIGPEKVRPWELIEGEVAYDREVYTTLMLRAIESVLVPVGVDESTLKIWLLGNAGYWGPPGTLPPPGVEIDIPLLEHSRQPVSWEPAFALGFHVQPYIADPQPLTAEQSGV